MVNQRCKSVYFIEILEKKVFPKQYFGYTFQNSSSSRVITLFTKLDIKIHKLKDAIVTYIQLKLIGIGASKEHN